MEPFFYRDPHPRHPEGMLEEGLDRPKPWYEGKSLADRATVITGLVALWRRFLKLGHHRFWLNRTLHDPWHRWPALCLQPVKVAAPKDD